MCLWNLACNGDNRVKIQHEKGIPLLVKLLRHPTPKSPQGCNPPGSPSPSPWSRSCGMAFSTFRYHQGSSNSRLMQLLHRRGRKAENLNP